MELLHIAIEDIAESPTNPRQDFNQETLAELAADIGLRGVLQPVLVRPITVEGAETDPDHFELVFGHRRLRAAVAAGLTEIPAICRVLTDVEVLESQLVENLKREDLHPLDVAKGLKELNETHGVSVDELAERLGKSKASIYASLKLCDLAPAAQDLFREGKLNASTALEVARIRDPEKQEERARAASELSFREAVEVIREPRTERVTLTDEEKAKKAAEKKRAARARAVARKAVAAMVGIVEAKEPDRKLWALLASSFDPYTIPETMARRCKGDEGTRDDELRHENEARYINNLPKMNEGQLRGFVFEAVTEMTFRDMDGNPTKLFDAACEHFKIDLKDLREEVKAEEKAAKVEPREPPPSPFFPPDSKADEATERVRKAVKNIVAKKKAKDAQS